MGYSTTFFKKKPVKMPTVTLKSEHLKNNEVLSYTHFSILYSADRRQPICTAVNIDGKTYLAIDRKSKTERWVYEVKIPKELQLDQSFYSKTNQEFHKGHLVRRVDPSWGLSQVAKKAEADTFHFTNASPQHRLFNSAIWLELERNILEKGAVAFDKRITVFAGPVLSPSDKPFCKRIKNQLVFIPSRFWKVIIWQKENKSYSAVGFMQSQRKFIDRLVEQSYGKEKVRRGLDSHFENIQFRDEAVYQVDIREIEKATGLRFHLKGIKRPKPKTKKKKLSAVEFPNDGSRFRSVGDFKTQHLSISGMVL